MERFDITKIPDLRGNLSFLECGKGLDFDICRVYWIYDIPADAARFGRALRSTAEVIVSIAGSFDVVTDDGHSHRSRITLSRPWHAVKLPPMTWRRLENFTSGSVVMVITSRPYDEADYIRDYAEFIVCCKDRPDETPSTESTFSRITVNYNVDNHAISSVQDCRMVSLDVHRHPGGGALSVVDNACPQKLFDINRVYYLYDVPADSVRGGHSHFHDNKLMIAVSGSFDVVVDDGGQKKRITLNRPYQALFVPAGIWRTMESFASGSVCLVLTSERFSEDDYVRDYDHFRSLTREKIM